MRTIALVVTSLLTAVVLFTLDATLLGQRSPAIAPSHLDADVLALACAPIAATSDAEGHARAISGGQDYVAAADLSQGDFVTLNAGLEPGA